MLSRYTWFGGRRVAGRRDSDAATFVDQHGSGLFAVVTLVLALNVLDAFFTVLFLTHGGTEMNPVVDQLLKFGTWPFVVVKSLGIGVCIAFLTVAKNFTAARFGLGFVLVGYTALLGWHCYLLTLLHRHEVL